MVEPEFSDKQSPELNKNDPGSLFADAKELEQQIRMRVREPDRAIAIDGLVRRLKEFVDGVFEERLPEITVEGSDISYMPSVSEIGGGEYRVRTAMLPLRGDAQLYGEHILEGTFHSFHRGAKNDLRIYLSRAAEPLVTPGGLITPLYSIGLQTSRVTLTSNKQDEQLKVPFSYINEHLLEYGEQALKDVESLKDILNRTELTVKDRLLASSAIVAKIEKRTKPSKPSPQFIDALLEIICLKLEIQSPQDLIVKQRRVFFTDHMTPAYKLEGPATLVGVSPQLALIGGFDDRMLGLHFLDKEERTIHVPVRDIVAIKKSKL